MCVKGIIWGDTELQSILPTFEEKEERAELRPAMSDCASRDDPARGSTYGTKTESV